MKKKEGTRRGRVRRGTREGEKREQGRVRRGNKGG